LMSEQQPTMEDTGTSGEQATTHSPDLLPAVDAFSGRARSRRLWLLLAIGAGALAAVIGLVLATRSGDEPITIHAGMTLTDIEGVEGTLGDCYGTGGYDDFGSGMDVVVRDGEGDVIGTGSTVGLDAAPEYFQDAALDDLDLTDEARGMCLVVADVETKPSEFYEVSIGRRGSLTYTSDELEEAKFEVMTSLG
jgi:hypothetical protein